MKQTRNHFLSENSYTTSHILWNKQMPCSHTLCHQGTIPVSSKCQARVPSIYSLGKYCRLELHQGLPGQVSRRDDHVPVFSLYPISTVQRPICVLSPASLSRAKSHQPGKQKSQEFKNNCIVLFCCLGLWRQCLYFWVYSCSSDAQKEIFWCICNNCK